MIRERPVSAPGCRGRHQHSAVCRYLVVHDTAFNQPPHHLYFVVRLSTQIPHRRGAETGRSRGAGTVLTYSPIVMVDLTLCCFSPVLDWPSPRSAKGRC